MVLSLQKRGLLPACAVFATDVNQSAAEATSATLKAHRVDSNAEIIVTDLVSGLAPRLDGLVDLLIFNPPYVPTPDEEVARGGIASAWAGGFRGRRVVDRLLPLVSQLLSPKGEFLLIALPDNDPEGKLPDFCRSRSSVYIHIFLVGWQHRVLN